MIRAKSNRLFCFRKEGGKNANQIFDPLLIRRVTNSKIVNIILTVNTKTKKVVITTTLRDSHVHIVLVGVDVDNDKAFTAKHNGQYYLAGRIHLNANQALGFVIFFSFHNLPYKTSKK